MTCQNCGANFEGNFCPVCGRPRTASANPTPPQYPPIQPSDINADYDQPITRKWWFWVLIGVTLVSLFITSQMLAPGQDSEDDHRGESLAVGQQADSAEQPTAPAKDGSVPPASSDSSNSFSSAPTGALPSIQETVLLDQGGIRATATGLDSDGNGPMINVLLENDTDRSVTLQTLRVSVNGIMFTPAFFSEVAAGTKSNDIISFYQGDLDSFGITSIQTIELTIEALETNSWDSLAVGDVITLSTDAPKATQAVDKAGTPALNQDGLEIVVRGVKPHDDDWGPEIMLYLNNQTGQNITVQLDDFSINGNVINPIFSCDIVDGKLAYNSIYLDTEDLKNNGIDRIDSITCSFIVCDPNTWDTIFESEPVTIQIPN